MGWKETWQHFKESFVHREKDGETAEERRQAREWDQALHQSDGSSGSETLDDRAGSNSR
jgi:hypothetical protein